MHEVRGENIQLINIHFISYLTTNTVKYSIKINSTQLSNNHTNPPINSVASLPGRLLLRYLDGIHDFESCIQSIIQSGRWPGNKVIGTYVIDSESEEAAAYSASMLGTPMGSEIECCCPCEVRLEVDVIPLFLSTTVLFFGSLLVRYRLQCYCQLAHRTMRILNSNC